MCKQCTLVANARADYRNAIIDVLVAADLKGTLGTLTQKAVLTQVYQAGHMTREQVAEEIAELWECDLL